VLRLIVGLGNPGRQYEYTRHNIGFWFVNRLAEQCGAKWAVEKKFNGLVASAQFGRQALYLLKPNTFMNLSGHSVAALLQYYQISINECLVVHDELDFVPGVVRLKQGGGHAGHNGLKSIIVSAGCNDFSRLRIGIGRPANAQVVADYVLSAPSKMEFEKIDAAIRCVFMKLELLVQGDFEIIMRELHN
jgi:peptidyl-tRNA hydrolase, PTH1 family